MRRTRRWSREAILTRVCWFQRTSSFTSEKFDALIKDLQNLFVVPGIVREANLRHCPDGFIKNRTI